MPLTRKQIEDKIASDKDLHERNLHLSICEKLDRMMFYHPSGSDNLLDNGEFYYSSKYLWDKNFQEKICEAYQKVGCTVWFIHTYKRFLWWKRDCLYVNWKYETDL